jgi:hypothetical protein
MHIMKWDMHSVQVVSTLSADLDAHSLGVLGFSFLQWTA